MSMVAKKIFSLNGIPHIGLFKGEVRPGIKFNLVNSQDPTIEYTIDPEYIHTKYKLIEWESNGKIFWKYEVQLSDLIQIEVEEKEDNHINEMTIRDFYSIIRNKPFSNKDWLNKLIKTTTHE